MTKSPKLPKSPKSLQGHLLLDSGKLRGSCFHRSVVLVCHHNAEGAFGLILNRPSDNKVGDVIEADLPALLHDEPLFGGGPVQPAALSYLHSGTSLSAGTVVGNVLSDLSVGHDLEELISISRNDVPGRRLRVFAGYAGWGPGQLDEEMRREAWLTERATLDLVFHSAPQGLWGHLLNARGDWQSRLLAVSPDDLSWN